MRPSSLEENNLCLVLVQVVGSRCISLVWFANPTMHCQLRDTHQPSKNNRERASIIYNRIQYSRKLEKGVNLGNIEF